MDDERADDSQAIARAKPPNSDSPTLERTSSGPRKNESDDAIPDPIREMGDEMALVREFESLPQHPIHLLDRFPYLPPIVGLIDLTRTVLRRRGNPFYHALLRRFWGRRPWLVVTGWILGLSLLLIPAGSAAGPAINKILTKNLLLPSALTFWQKAVFFFYPTFLFDPLLFIGTLYASKIRRLVREPGFRSELDLLPNARISILRAIMVQLIATVILLDLLYPPVSNVFFIQFHPKIAATILPPGSSFLRWVTYFLGFPTTPPPVMISLLSRFQTFCSDLLFLPLLVLCFVRGRTVPQAIGLALILEFACRLYDNSTRSIFLAIERWASGQILLRTVIQWSETILLIAVYLMVLGAIWYWIRRRLARAEM